MIDWYLVLTSSSWILGLSVVLATASYHRWDAHEAGRTLREQWNRRACRLPFSAGLVLIAVGFAAGEGEPWWGRAAWIALAAFCGWLGIARTRGASSPSEQGER